MSPKKRKPSVAFSWHKSFAILAPWRKGKGDMVVESEVVLTKMKVFNTFHEKWLNAEDSVSTVSISVSEQNISPTLLEEVISVHSDAPEPTMAESKQDYLSAIFSDSQLPRLYKFESEDSGVEMPSGANSPSTPTGSEQSFVVHSRGSSCDLGTLNSSIPANSPLLLLEQSTGSLETEQTSCIYTQDDDLTLLQDSLEDEMDNILLGIAGDSEIPQDGTLGNVSESSKVSLVCADTAEARAEELAGEDMGSRSHDIEAYDGNTGAELQQQPLRKSTTSDSLDEYMEECCRLSEVNQAQSNPLGSGLGYLEHICQLIEKIGQLQEHNLKLQKEIYSLQKDSKMTKTKEDFFIQHCYCGAANLAFQELKRHSRSDYPSLTASSSTLSDLTTIPEGTRIPLHPAVRDVAGGHQLTAPLRRRGLNRRSYTEGEARYLSDSAEGLSATHRRVRHTDQLLENYTWGRMKELVKKTRLRNQSRLGLSSGSLKRSCPQLYRPELGPLELCRRDRNSMIVLGHQKLDYHWSH
ncbi:uncharacterized protein si:ch211-250c4.3 isoform X2 [Electrophorus electricus]|uniref:uncharacterized protein si:ch211-250c4.3 isoform X2 n=1 Tax=Electrophorus electricus TaxID=8005 RepID=UPI0015D0067F|nr:uncharacterized protein si:ch211-250c4.3 isoform X2 [Electrophorus electricus]